MSDLKAIAAAYDRAVADLSDETDLEAAIEREGQMAQDVRDAADG
jgi:hypothetical protein